MGFKKTEKSSPRKMKQKSDFTVAMLFISPFIIGFFLFILYPTAMSLYYSFTDFNALTPPVFAGLKNYLALLTDKLYFKAVLNTIYILIVGTPLVCGTGLLIAIILNHKIPFLGVFRTIVYLPAVIPTVAAALIWTWIFNPEYGLMNTILNQFGVPKIGWLADPAWSKFSLVIMSIWGVGNVMVMYLAALQDVSKELYESASIDGAGSFLQFFQITIPMIRPVMMYNIIVTAIAFLHYFAQAYVVNNVLSPPSNILIGIPLGSTMFYGSYIYIAAFKYLKFGFSSAMAWILLIVSLLATFLLFKTSHMLDTEK
jgi:multiple sugar transport system permease protein